MNSYLDTLKNLAQAATPRTGRLSCVREDCFCPECALQIAVPAERILQLIAVIEAAKAMRAAGFYHDPPAELVAADKLFDAALAALETANPTR